MTSDMILNDEQSSLFRGRERRALRSYRPQRGQKGSAAAAPEELKGTFEASRQKTLPWPVLLFLVAIIVPWIITLGDIRLSSYRIVLIATLIPSLVKWASGKAGPIRATDLALLMYSVWSVVSLFTVHGWSAGLQPSAILFIETTSAYFLARSYIRCLDDFYNMTRFLFWMVVLVLPFAIVEAFSGQNVFLKLFSMVLPSTPYMPAEPRWGLRRVQAFAEHPILFGVCVGSFFSLVHLVLGYGRSVIRRFAMSGVIAVATFLSLSAGPMGALAVQGLLITWDRMFRNYKWRWRIILGAVFVINLAIAAIPNESLIMFYIKHLTFDEFTAYFRVLIWQYASQSALNHPFFGVGLGEWERPYWMPESIDMFWLIHAVRYGIPAALLMLLAFTLAFFSVSSKKDLNDRLSACRAAYLLCMAGFFLAGWAVHYWSASYVLFLFLLGSGLWLLEVETSSSGEEGGLQHRRRRGSGKMLQG
ncbi:O-antigen ligase family protein [Microvirga sp. 0TCS3.31]